MIRRKEESKKTLERGGEEVSGERYVIALAGNPNTGKSTVFNYLTGLRQHTGNWPGKTVARAEGAFRYASREYKIVDLPGTYSLLSTSEDEEIARNFILFAKPDITLIVADATRLERNLHLVLQILEITDSAILIVNLLDEAHRHGLTIDLNILRERLKIPVVGTSARSGKGMQQLLKEIDTMISCSKDKPKPFRIPRIEGKSGDAILELTERLTRIYPDLPNAEWIAMRLLDGDEEIRKAVKYNSWGED